MTAVIEESLRILTLPEVAAARAKGEIFSAAPGHPHPLLHGPVLANHGFMRIPDLYAYSRVHRASCAARHILSDLLSPIPTTSTVFLASLAAVPTLRSFQAGFHTSRNE